MVLEDSFDSPYPTKWLTPAEIEYGDFEAFVLCGNLGKSDGGSHIEYRFAHDGFGSAERHK